MRYERVMSPYKTWQIEFYQRAFEEYEWMCDLRGRIRRRRDPRKAMG